MFDCSCELAVCLQKEGSRNALGVKQEIGVEEDSTTSRIV